MAELAEKVLGRHSKLTVGTPIVRKPGPQSPTSYDITIKRMADPRKTCARLHNGAELKLLIPQKHRTDTLNTMVESVTTNYCIGDSNGNKYIHPFSSQVTITHQAQRDDFNNYCTHCDLTFENLTECEHHNIEMHGQKKVLTCAICTATFRRQDHLKRHMQSLHGNQKFCLCPVCGQDYKRQDLLLKHIKRKHATGPQIYHCRECEYECGSLLELEKHELTHLLTERHICPHCETSFKRRDHMLRHVKSQHLNQFVVCPLCSQTYKRKDHLVRHVREKHKMGFLNGKLIKSSDIV